MESASATNLGQLARSVCAFRATEHKNQTRCGAFRFLREPSRTSAPGGEEWFTASEPIALVRATAADYCFGGNTDCGGEICIGLDESCVETCAGCCAGFGSGIWTGLSGGGTGLSGGGDESF